MEEEGHVEGVEEAHLEGDKELLVVPLLQLLPVGLGVLDSHGVEEAVAQKVELTLCVALWLEEGLPFGEALTVRVPLLQ
jgi:hypothetical protein